MSGPDRPNETVFTWGAPPIKFGSDALGEVGYDVAAMRLQGVGVITDPGLTRTELPDRLEHALAAADVEATRFDQVRVEPTDDPIRAAADWARGRGAQTQQRPLSISPRQVGDDDLVEIFEDSMHNW